MVVDTCIACIQPDTVDSGYGFSARASVFHSLKNEHMCENTKQYEINYFLEMCTKLEKRRQTGYRHECVVE